MEKLNTQVDWFLHQEIEPQLIRHGGAVELVSLDEGIMKIKLKGKCCGCPSANLTTSTTIKEAVVKAFPQIKEVILLNGVSENLLEETRRLMRYRRV